MIHTEVRKQVKDAMCFLVQAQAVAPPASDLWKEIDKIWEQAETVVDMLSSEEFDAEGKLK